MRAKMNGPTERLIIQAGQRLRLQLALKELIRQGLVPLPEFRRVWLEVARPGANPNTGASPRNSRGKTQ